MVAALTEHPEAVWAGAAAQAVLAAAVPDLSHLGFWCGRDGLSTGLLSIDAGTGYWGMSWVQGGRAVIYGRDHHSDTHLHVPPVDLLAGAPDWLPWDWLHDVMTELDTVAYVFWWNGTAWARAPHPADADPGQCHSSGRVEEAYLDLVDPHRYRDAVRALDDLHRAARDRTVTRAHVDALTRLLDETALTREPDPRAALDTARTCGVAPGATRPELPAGHGEPADRRVVFTGAPQRLLSTAMRQAAEQHRPPPDPGTALDRVADWLRARHPDGIAVAYLGDHDPQPATAARSGFLDPDGRPVDPELSDLLTAWRTAETHPEHGSWLYARIRPTATGARADRAYDRLPDWWPTAAVLHTQWQALRAEMRARHPRWRPDWAPLLEDDLRKTGIPPHLCWRPGP